MLPLPSSRHLAGAKPAAFALASLLFVGLAATPARGQGATPLVINEIMQNPSAVADSAGEWFELYNPTSTPVDIDGWTIADNGIDVHVIANGGPLVVPANGFLVLGNNADPSTNGGVTIDYTYGSSFFLANGDDELVLIDASGAEIDRVGWDGGPSFPDPTGASMALSDPALPNDVGANWCTSTTAFGAGDFGTPGAVNDCGGGGPGPGPSLPLVVNEIDYDQPGADTAEFVEIYNTSHAAVSLAGVSLQLVNGSGNAPYDTIPLPAISLLGGDYYVVCADAAATPECDLQAISSIQNGSPDAVALLSGTAIIDTVSYEGDVVGYTEGSGAGLVDLGTSGNDFKGISRFPDGIDTGRNNVDFTFACITPGAMNTSLSAGCSLGGGIELEIYEIQGSGLASPYEGPQVTPENNAVTAVAPNGFFIQTPAARSDNDANTSDGLFVFTGSAPTVAVGDLVSVSGVVTEFFDFTELTSASVDFVAPGGAVLPAPVIFDTTLPSPDPTVSNCGIEFECWEGMLIDVPQGAVGSGNQGFGSDPIAEVFVVAGPWRAFREPGIEYPGLPGLPVWDGNPEVFELDPDKLGLPNEIIPGGSTFSARGVLGYEFGGYELWPSELTVDRATMPVAVRDKQPGEYTVGTLNLYRLFDDVDDPGPEDDGQVVSSAEFAARLGKFSMYIRGLMRSPDILGVQEVESLSVLQDLAAQIASDDPAVVYTAYLEEGNDVGGIDVGFLVRDTIDVESVEQLGAAEILSVDGSLLHDRPPLVLHGRVGSSGDGGQKVTVMVVHNRSLSGIEDPDDGPRVRQKRLEQAESIARKVQQLQRAGAGLVVIGDFNAYEFSDGYVDAVGHIKGDFDPAESLLFGSDLVRPDLTDTILRLPASERYSFVFAGSAQVLDHALVSNDLRNKVRGVAFARGNADGAEVFEADDSTPLRSSDHDGLVIFLRGPVQ